MEEHPLTLREGIIYFLKRRDRRYRKTGFRITYETIAFIIRHEYHEYHT